MYTLKLKDDIFADECARQLQLTKNKQKPYIQTVFFKLYLIYDARACIDIKLDFPIFNTHD